MLEHVHATAHVWKSEDTCRSCYSPPLWVLEIEHRSLRLSGNQLYLLRLLTGLSTTANSCKLHKGTGSRVQKALMMPSVSLVSAKLHFTLMGSSHLMDTQRLMLS